MLDVVERLKAMGHDPGLVTAGLAMDKPELDFVKVKFSMSVSLFSQNRVVIKQIVLIFFPVQSCLVRFG